jgi:hypothetical protein
MLTAILVAEVLTGCSSPGVVNDAALQQGISLELARQLGDPWQVDCPDGQPLETGHAFACEAVSTTDAATVTITVTVDDDEGHVSWQTVDDSVKVP